MLVAERRVIRRGIGEGRSCDHLIGLCRDHARISRELFGNRLRLVGGYRLAEFDSAQAVAKFLARLESHRIDELGAGSDRRGFRRVNARLVLNNQARHLAIHAVGGRDLHGLGGLALTGGVDRDHRDGVNAAVTQASDRSRVRRGLDGDLLNIGRVVNRLCPNAVRGRGGGSDLALARISPGERG